MKWLMVGTAPSVLATLPRLNLGEFDCTITCNAGIRLLPCPDVYVCVDMLASRAYAPEASLAQLAGTKLVTLRRDRRALCERQVEHYNEFLELGRGGPTRQSYAEYRYTGPLCLEYACHHGANEVVMVGFDGYRNDDDYFDNSVPRKDGMASTAEERTQQVLRPACIAIADCWSDVKFTQVGNPAFTVGTSNWEAVRW